MKTKIMLRTSGIGGAALLTFALMAGANTAHANAITVLNASFEALPPGGLPFPCTTNPVGCSFSSDLIPNWTEIATGGSAFGQIRPGVASGNTSVFNSVPDGLTVGYVTGSGNLSQLLSASLVAGLSYTLQVGIGMPKSGVVASTQVGIELLAGSTIIAFANASPTAGNWATVTAAYASPLADALAGQALSIVLVQAGAANFSQGDFDNVRLNNSLGTNAPEPASFGLVGLALGLVVFGSRRRALRTLRVPRTV